MPFVNNMEDDEDKKQGPGGQTGPGAVSPGGAGGSAVRLAPGAGVEGGGTSAGKVGPSAAGGQFASLDRYLKANVGQAEPLAGKLTSEIGKQYQGLEGQNQQALSKIGGQVSANPSYDNANEIISEASANPVSFTSDPNKTESFQNLLKASYSGPKSAESTNEFADQQSAINNAIAKGQGTVKTEAGRSNLIKDVSARPTSGVTALNSAILSKSPEALASVENAYKPFQNLIGGLQTGAAETNKAIAAKQSQADAARTQSAEALKSGITGLNANVGQELTTAQKNLAAQNEKVKAELAAGTPSDTTLQTLGLSRDQWNSLSAAQKAAATPQDVYSNQRQFGATTGTTNIDLGQFLNQTDPNAINAGNVATKEDYDKAQAFRTLMGNLNLGAPDLVINPNAVAQAGTAPTKGSQFNYDDAVNVAKQAKEDQLAAAQAYVDALQSGADEEHAQLAAAKAAKNKSIAAASAIGNTMVGATGAAAVGGADAGKTYFQKLSSSNPAQIAATVGTMGLAPVAQAVGHGVVQAAKTVGKIFCFHPDTLVTMDNGSQLPICRIGVGDITKGGKVLATTRAIGQDFYWYNGVIVTAKHAVKEDGKWVRVENSRLGHKFNYLTEVVCNLVTENHRIYANGIEFADQYETDLYESLDMDQSLQELNRNA